MTNDKNKPDDVLAAITGGKVTMRPKWRFVLEHIGIGAAMILVAIGLVYLGSFIGYVWRSARFVDLPVFGPEGYLLLVRTFPWWQSFFILIGAVAFVYLVRKTTHLYRWPLAVIIGAFIIAFAAAAFVTDTTHVHDQLANRTYDDVMVPLVGPLYKHHQPLAQGLITPGIIEEVSANSLEIVTANGDITVLVTPTTKVPYAWAPDIGDEIVVIGQWEDNTITALGIRPAEELPSRRPFRMHSESERYPPAPAY